ncbi:MAG: PKD domain-containing protein [Candidatus Spechtbacterales bacterium]
MGRNAEQAAKEAAANANSRSGGAFTATAHPLPAGAGWRISFTGNCNNGDLAVLNRVPAITGCVGAFCNEEEPEDPDIPPPGGGGGENPPPPVPATPTPPSSPALAPPPSGSPSPDPGSGSPAPSPNNPPTVSNPSASIRVGSTVPCTTNVYTTWTFSDAEDGSVQTGYHIQIDNNGTFGSPEYDSGSVTSSTKELHIPVGNQIAFNATYFWRLRARDSAGLWSNWQNGNSFATPLHARPTVGFSWSPQNPIQEQAVQFTDESTAAGGATIAEWSWTFNGGTPSLSTLKNPTTSFSSAGSKSVALSVTDSDNYSCSLQQSVTVVQSLPDVDEVPPSNIVGGLRSVGKHILAVIAGI